MAELIVELAFSFFVDGLLGSSDAFSRLLKTFSKLLLKPTKKEGSSS